MKRLLSLTLTAILVSACGGDASGPPVSAEGTYTLARMNGSAVPTLWAQASDARIDIVSGSMVLRSDFSYRQTNEFRITWNDGSVTTDDWLEIGTYNVSGRRITFTIDTEDGSVAPPYSGSVDPGVVAYTFDGVSYQFEK